MTPVVGPDEGPRYHKDFTLSITKALGDQLAAALDGLEPAPLHEDSIKELRERAGVYQLYLNGEFVYVGKAERSLPARLRNHLLKISGRRRISLEDTTFSCLYVAEDFSALAPEQLLISHHKGMGNIPWNNNGFGNKDPGRQRDHTIPNRFDVQFPIDLDRPVEGLESGEITLHDLLEKVKAGLPYNFRYGRSAAFKDQLFTVPEGQVTADEVFRLVSAAIPDKWQITALVGYVIMYDDSPAVYNGAWRYYRAGQAIDVEPGVEPGVEPPGDVEVDQLDQDG
ncbi:GIY-YIG nuclease family protein [Kitasatospora sp. NPDC058478]|uniref:GIY-YIG nuclease family protein n=1 Tax=unclassified Kitasatospora TaxID=2633591 RepID=UPI00365F4450